MRVTAKVVIAAMGLVPGCSPNGALPDRTEIDAAEFDGAFATDVPGDTVLDGALPSDVTDADASTGPVVDGPCGAFHGVDTWNCAADGATLVRTLGGSQQSVTCSNGCVSMPYGFHDQCRVRPGTLSNIVNGHAMNAAETAWSHYVALCVVPRLQGTRDDRLTAAARVTWWSLKEGVLDVTNPNPVGFSLCTMASGDVRIGPTATCATGMAWQVGASAVQVPCCSLAQVEASAAALFPGLTSNEVIATAATEANDPVGTATGDAIVNSTGSLRTSWLLRVSAIGFTFQAPIVTNECITQSLSWCYSTAWSPSSLYAPTRAAAMQSIADLRTVLDLLSD